MEFTKHQGNVGAQLFRCGIDSFYFKKPTVMLFLEELILNIFKPTHPKFRTWLKLLSVNLGPK